MNDRTVAPALTPVEWADEIGESGPRSEADVVFDRDGTVTTGLPLSVYWRRDRENCEPSVLHALAAVSLHGQPFGFTREMLDFLRQKQAQSVSGRGGVDAHLFAEIADRIAALLPPDRTK